MNPPSAHSSEDFGQGAPTVGQPVPVIDLTLSYQEQLMDRLVDEAFNFVPNYDLDIVKFEPVSDDEFSAQNEEDFTNLWGIFSGEDQKILF
jgi:hypothetical protein